MSEADMHKESMATPGSSGRPLSQKAIMTVLLTALVGPPIGTVVLFLITGFSPELGVIFFMFLGGTSTGITSLAAGAGVSQALLLLGHVILLGYIAGGVQATICGLIFAICGWSFGRLPIWVPIGATLFLAAVFNVLIFGLAIRIMPFSILIHIVPALATWLLVRKYWQKADS